MKFWLLIFVAFFANYFSLRNTTECVNKEKMRPSFDEIFGKGWDEEEKEQQKMDESQQNNGGGNGITNKNQMSDNDKTEEQNKVGDQKEKDQPTDQEKRTIIEKFHLVKEKLKEIGQFPRRKRTEIERQIGKELLGVSLHKIHKWKSEFDQYRKNKCYSDQEKRKTIQKFDLIKEKLKEIGKFPSKKRVKIEHQIGRQLGINRKTIYKWKKELCITNPRRSFSDREKRDTIQKFDLIKLKLKEIGKYPSRKRVKIEHQIGRQLGVNRDKIYKWKKEFEKSRKMNKKGNNYYKQKKREFIERLEEFIVMMEEGKMQKIAEELGITGRTVRNWKRQMGF